MDERERAIRIRLRDDFIHYSTRCLKIRDKDGNIVPFTLNKAQLHLHKMVEQQRAATGRVRVIIVKGRQQGMSTYTGGRFYHQVTQSKGKRVFILTHEDQATNNLFDMVKRYHEHCPDIMKPTTRASNAKELIFSKLDSGYMLGTAGNKSVGRSATIQLFHGSEVAYWPNAEEHAKGILQSVPRDRSEIFLESTADGIGNYFHEQWQLAEEGISQFMPIFIPWYWNDEYKAPLAEGFTLTDEEIELKRIYSLNDNQIMWRREKIVENSHKGLPGLRAFMSQYPCTPTEAFQTTGEDSFITPSEVMAARKCNAEPVGALIVGVDPARFGDDRTSIIRRKGRVAYGLNSFHKKDTMSIAGMVHRIINDESPTRVCIDIGGLGAGVYDRLKELGHADVIVAVNSAETALNEDRYCNKRSEMWGLMRQWLLEQPAQIPDMDTLHADLCGLRYEHDSKDRLKMEKKSDAKKRGIRSPDEADALALTFALPEKALTDSSKKKYDAMAKSMLSSSNQIDRLKKSAYK